MTVESSVFSELKRYGEFKVDKHRFAIAGYETPRHLWIYETNAKPQCIGAIVYLNTPKPGVTLTGDYSEEFKAECAKQALETLRENGVWTA